MTTRESLDRAFDLRGTPRGTRDAYGWCINRYEGYFGRPASALGREEVETFLLHLVRERKLGPSTHNVYAAALRFVYGAALGRPEVTAGIPRRKTPMRLPMLLSPEQIARLLGAVADRHQQPATGVPTRRAGDLPHEGRQGHHAGRPGLPRPFHPAGTPPGFVKIRHYGLMAPSNATTKLALARALLNPTRTNAPGESSAPSTSGPVDAAQPWQQLLHELTGIDVRRCPACGELAVVRRPLNGRQCHRHRWPEVCPRNGEPARHPTRYASSPWNRWVSARFTMPLARPVRRSRACERSARVLGPTPHALLSHSAPPDAVRKRPVAAAHPLRPR
jgi:hypothetical protein